MAEIINGVPIGDLPGIESVPDDSMLVVEFLGKAYHMPGAVLRQMIQDVLDSMGDSVDDVTEARLTTAIETVLASGKYNGVSPSVEVLDEEGNPTSFHNNYGDVVQSGFGGLILEDHALGEMYMYELYKGDGSYAGGEPGLGQGPVDGMIRTIITTTAAVQIQILP